MPVCRQRQISNDSRRRLAQKVHAAKLVQVASRISAVMKFGAGAGDDLFLKVKV